VNFSPRSAAAWNRGYTDVKDLSHFAITPWIWGTALASAAAACVAGGVPEPRRCQKRAGIRPLRRRRGRSPSNLRGDPRRRTDLSVGAGHGSGLYTVTVTSRVTASCRKSAVHRRSTVHRATYWRKSTPARIMRRTPRPLPPRPGCCPALEAPNGIWISTRILQPQDLASSQPSRPSDALVDHSRHRSISTRPVDMLAPARLHRSRRPSKTPRSYAWSIRATSCTRRRPQASSS